MQGYFLCDMIELPYRCIINVREDLKTLSAHEVVHITNNDYHD